MTQSTREPGKAPTPVTKQADPVRQDPENGQSAQDTKGETQAVEQTAEEARRIEEMLDQAGKDSFPASDPPSWVSRGPED